MFQIIKVICHQHDLEKKNLKLSDSLIVLNKDKENYLNKILLTNSKRNSGKLAEFNSNGTANKFYKQVRNIYDHKDFVKCSKVIMSDLIFKETLPQSTSGNYLFTLYNYKKDESYIDNDGKIITISIDEERFGLLKFEFQDSRHIEYKQVLGKIVSDIHIENLNGLPGEYERVKKAVFINNFDKNKLNYEMRVVDKETRSIANFFTVNILDCKYKIRPHVYIGALKNESSDFVNTLRQEKLIDEPQSKTVINKFFDLIKIGNQIDQSSLGKTLFGDFFEDEELEEINNRFIERLHSKGLTYNRFEVSSKDVEYFFTNQLINFGNRSSLRFSQADVAEGFVIIPDDKEKINNAGELKYVVKIVLDSNPKEMIRKNTR